VQQGVTVRELGTILGVWAHPDDEAYLSAALMAEARDAGQSVVVATATDGELGGEGPVADRRRLEVMESLAVVGVTDHRWLGFRDGQCAGVSPEVGDRVVRALIEQVHPDTVVTFGPGRCDRPPGPRGRVRLGRAGLAGGRVPRPAAVGHAHGELPDPRCHRC
jgi:LmbE family N-acetylglucosaminyl deacetylase